MKHIKLFENFSKSGDSIKQAKANDELTIYDDDGTVTTGIYTGKTNVRQNLTYYEILIVKCIESKKYPGAEVYKKGTKVFIPLNLPSYILKNNGQSKETL